MDTIPAGPTQFIGSLLTTDDIRSLERADRKTKQWAGTGWLWKGSVMARTGLTRLPTGCVSWREFAKREAIGEQNLKHLRFQVTSLDKRLYQRAVPLELKVDGMPYLAAIMEDQRSITIWNPLFNETLATLWLPEEEEKKLERIHLLGSKEDARGIFAQFDSELDSTKRPDFCGRRREATNHLLIPIPLGSLPCYAWDVHGRPLTNLINALTNEIISCFEFISTHGSSPVLATIIDKSLFVWDVGGHKEALDTSDSANKIRFLASSITDERCSLFAVSETVVDKYTWTKDDHLDHVSFPVNPGNNFTQDSDRLLQLSAVFGDRYPYPEYAILKRKKERKDLLFNLGIHRSWTSYNTMSVCSFYKTSVLVQDRRNLIFDARLFDDKAGFMSYPLVSDWVAIEFGGVERLVMHGIDRLAFFDIEELEKIALRTNTLVQTPTDDRFAIDAHPWVTTAHLDGLFPSLLLNTSEGVKWLSFVENQGLEQAQMVALTQPPPLVPTSPPPPRRPDKWDCIGAVVLLLLGAYVCRMGYKRLYPR